MRYVIDIDYELTTKKSIKVLSMYITKFTDFNILYTLKEYITIL